jgi:predicted HTH domain antitoxin
MQITVQLPDDLAQHANPGREALEALALEGYRSGTLSHFETSQLLGLSRFELDGLLKQRNISDRAYDSEDLAQDLDALRQLRVKGGSTE